MPWFLVIWSGAAACWWFIAFALVLGRRTASSRVFGGPGILSIQPPGERSGVPSSPSGCADMPSGDGSSSQVRLSVFKPVPRVSSSAELAGLAEALESFLAQLHPEDELLLGLDEGQLAHWQPVLGRWREQYPAADLQVIDRVRPRDHANPKVAWLEALSRHARGDVWLWSDADIVAPPNLLSELCATLAQQPAQDARAVTCPYHVRRVQVAPAVLDAAFVNAEFLPGALLLGRRAHVAFAFGAATIFRAADFLRLANWERLGASLADDYELGRQLGSVTLRGPLVETLASETTFGGALRHYHRWQKTIRWCRPGSYAALLSITPMLGWATWTAMHRDSFAAWAGLGVQWGFEYLVGVGLCVALRCRCSPGAWAFLAAWPLLRAFAWLGVWFPLAVFWRGSRQLWQRPMA